MNQYELIADLQMPTGKELELLQDIADTIAKYSKDVTTRIYKLDSGEDVRLKNELLDEIKRLKATVSEYKSKEDAK